jgi:hypothetical protein
MFAAGAVIGSAVTWKFIKTRYEQIAQEEIESVKSAFTEMMAINQDQNEDECEDFDEDQEQHQQIDWSELENLEDEDDDEDVEEDESDYAESNLREYSRLLNDYTNDDEKGGVDNMTKEPYVIDPYEFGERDGYRKFELTYYADGTLEDEEYNLVRDYEKLIGRDSLNTFGQYEDDSVVVRNDDLKSDFMILKDYRTYEQARSISPKQVADE